jgi:hypothetical protein
MKQFEGYHPSRLCFKMFHQYGEQTLRYRHGIGRWDCRYPHRNCPIRSCLKIVGQVQDQGGTNCSTAGIYVIF